MSMCRVFSCVVGRGCLLWPVHSLGKILLAFALLYSVFQGQISLLFQVFLDFLLLRSSPLWWKGHLFWVLVLEGLVGLHGTVRCQLLQHYWLWHRLGLLWYLMVCLGNATVNLTPTAYLLCISLVSIIIWDLLLAVTVQSESNRLALSALFITLYFCSVFSSSYTYLVFELQHILLLFSFSYSSWYCYFLRAEKIYQCLNLVSPRPLILNTMLWSGYY